jgi:predicted dehydrogenase
MIGAGWVAPFHLRGWQALADEAVVVAIADPSADNATLRGEAFGISRLYRNAEEMMISGGIDAVDIVAPRALHADLVRLAARHGLDTMCQKPLGRTLAEARQLVGDVSGKIRLMVHENWRFRAHYRQAADWIANGYIGDVKAVSMALVTSGAVPGPDGSLPALERQPFMRTEKRMLVAEVLIHHLDTLRMLLGPMTVRDAMLSRTSQAVAGEDGATLLLQTAGGASVSVFGTFAAYGAPAESRDRLVILGECGAIHLEGTELRLSGRREERISFHHDEAYQGSYTAAIAHFIRSLRAGTPFETSCDDNLETLLLVEECYRISGWAAVEAEAP